mgnify:CR=1 FL=1
MTDEQFVMVSDFKSVNIILHIMRGITPDFSGIDKDEWAKVYTTISKWHEDLLERTKCE